MIEEEEKEEEEEAHMYEAARALPIWRAMRVLPVPGGP